jgi:hypothetical protein
VTRPGWGYFWTQKRMNAPTSNQRTRTKKRPFGDNSMRAGLKIFFHFPVETLCGAGRTSGASGGPGSPQEGQQAGLRRKWTLLSINLNLSTLCSNPLIYTRLFLSHALLIYYFYSKFGRGR